MGVGPVQRNATNNSTTSEKDEEVMGRCIDLMGSASSDDDAAAGAVVDLCSSEEEDEPGPPPAKRKKAQRRSRAQRRVQSNKEKGRRLQRLIAADLARALALDAADVRSASMGAAGEDVLLSPRARSAFPYSIECKNAERLNIWAALAQAAANAPAAATPLVVFTRAGTPAYAALPWDAFLNLAS